MADRKCSRCGIEKPLEQFAKHPDCRDGRTTDCKECRKAYRRGYLRTTNFASCKRYEKTKRGFLVRTYRNMQSRVTGVQWRKAHLYAGKPLLPRETFYEWAITSGEFHALFEAWELSGHSRSYTPSVDRIDSSRGYELDNMEWVAFFVNCQRGARARHRKAAA